VIISSFGHNNKVQSKVVLSISCFSSLVGYFYILTALFGFAGLFGLWNPELSYMLFIKTPSDSYKPTEVEKGVFRLVS